MRAFGFTLLEMLVVLVIMGMAAALVAPALSRTAERVRAAGDRDDVRRMLEGLPAAARERGSAIAIGTGAAIDVLPRAWPEGWRVRALDPINVAANGWCSGGRVQADGPDGGDVLTLGAPDCRIAVLSAP